MSVADSTTPCVCCKGASLDATVVVVGVIGGVVDSVVSTGST